GRRRRQGRHGLRRDRRVRLPGGGKPPPRPRPARDDVAPVGVRSHETDVPLRGSGFSVDRRVGAGDSGDHGLSVARHSSSNSISVFLVSTLNASSLYSPSRIILLSLRTISGSYFSTRYARNAAVTR